MLYHIVDPEYFDSCLANVEKALWPEEEYIAQKENLAFANKPKNEDARLEQTANNLREICEKVASSSTIYNAISYQGDVTKLPFPLLDRFHGLFMERKWTEPYKDPEARADELFRLERNKNGEGKYSKHVGNYNHFVNVVAAMARLIIYFKEPDHIRRAIEERAPEYTTAVYGERPDMRTFKLMLAAFYHDIGKTILDARHAMEGSIILAHHTSTTRHQLHAIVKEYDPSYEFERNDFLFVSDLVFYHDQYGTLGTGEDSYMPLVNVIDVVKRYSLKHYSSQESLTEWTRKYLFDLWLLNVADIMVSVGEKFTKQSEWLTPKESNESIEKFLFGTHGSRLIHDLKITFNMLKIHCNTKHSDDLSDLEDVAHKCSKRHVNERLHRLMVSSLVPMAKDWKRKHKDKPNNVMIATQLEKLTEGYWNAAIVRSIKAVADLNEFSERFSWIGKMDYALGFFRKIAKAALDRVDVELDGGPPTGWIREPSDRIGIEDMNIEENEYLAKTHAQFFAENYAATVIQILGYLLFREPSIDRIRNIEFSDARKRFTDEKAPLLLSLEGPARTRKSIQHILQTIYFY